MSHRASRGIFVTVIFLAFAGLEFVRPQSTDDSSSASSALFVFDSNEPLGVRLSYVSEEILKISNDSTYIGCELSYLEGDEWKNLEAEIRIRGGFRRTYCFFTPLKLKVSQESSVGTPFEKDRKAKLVLPCLKSKKADDNLLKELMGYKIFEVLSPYHFKTRLLDVELKWIRKNKTDVHHLMGFMIQDDESFSRWNEAKEIERFMDYQALNEKYRVINALFQYMIGNTDFSTVYLHNEKLFYVNDMIVPVPYDFDMSGLVDASYAVVSQVKNEVLPIDQVTKRLYRGFQADHQTLEEVRSLFLEKEKEVSAAIESLKAYFKDPKEYDLARTYIEGFYEILKDDKKFSKRIADKGRKN